MAGTVSLVQHSGASLSGLWSLSSLRVLEFDSESLEFMTLLLEHSGSCIIKICHESLTTGIHHKMIMQNLTSVRYVGFVLLLPTIACLDSTKWYMTSGIP